MTSPFFVYPEMSVLSVDDDQVEDPRARPEMQKRAPNSQDVVQSKDASDGGWGGGGFRTTILFFMSNPCNAVKIMYKACIIRFDSVVVISFCVKKEKCYSTVIELGERRKSPP